MGSMTDRTTTLIPPAAPQTAAPARASAPVPVGRVPRFTVSKTLLNDSFFSNLKDFLFARPIKIAARPGAPFTRMSYGGGFAENFKEFFHPTPPLPRGAQASGFAVDWNAGFGSFSQRVKEFFVPRKLPPLPFAIKPVKVKDIWSKDENFGWTQAASIALHASLIALLMIPVVAKVRSATPPKSAVDVIPLDISPYISKLPAGANKAGGGGGGGSREQLPPTKGRAPKFDWKQFTPPMATIKNPNPKLPMNPTLLGPPELRISNPALSNYGDPLAAAVNYSGGPGGGGGIGTGEGGGIGSGTGGGLGPGSGGGTGGGVFRAGINGVGIPVCIYCPDPQYSEEARKAKYQGTVTLQIIVTTDGRAANIVVVQGPGLGLEEKAVEAVRGWRFKPAIGPSGKPVATIVPVEVTFRLF
jgi:protein TonB